MKIITQYDYERQSKKWCYTIIRKLIDVSNPIALIESKKEEEGKIQEDNCIQIILAY